MHISTRRLLLRSKRVPGPPAPPAVIPNLLVASESLASTAWKTVFSPTSVESNVDGTADEVTYDTTNYASRQHIDGLTPGQTYSYTVAFKQGRTASAVAVRLTANNRSAWNTGGSTKHVLTAGYQRITHTWTQQGTTTAAIMLGALDEAGNEDPDCYGKVLVKEAMLNVGATAATYQFAAAPAEALAKVFGCYWPSWDTSFAITAVPEIFNVIWLFHCTPLGPNPGTNNNGDGTFQWEYGYAVSNAQIQTVRARGQKVVLSVGGQNNGYNFNTRAKSTNFVNSMVAIINAMGGVDGVDFNNFEAGISSDTAEMIWIAQQLRATYGSDFLITAPPGDDAAADKTMLKAMLDAGCLSFCGPQYYAWSGFTPTYVKTSMDSWFTLMGESVMTVGFGANYDYASSLNLAETIEAWDLIKAAHPNVRGMYFWNAQTNLATTSAGEAEADGNNLFGTTMHARL